jgi:hypothetical protein
MRESIYDMEFIHLGNNKLYELNPVKNFSGFANKPVGGLWASAYKLDEFGHRSNWERYAYASEIRFYEEYEYIRFKIKRCPTVSPLVLIINSLEDLDKLDRALFNTIRNTKDGNKYLCLNFELIAQIYDAFYLTENGESELSCIGPEYGYVPFNYWDCDTLIVFNKSIIKITDKGED